MTAGGERRECPWCGAATIPVHVHGHAQCGGCGANIEPCCDGASAADEASHACTDGALPDPQLFARVFSRLGPAGATVTGQALRFALAEQLATDLDGARLVLEAGLHTGAIAADGDDGYRLAAAPK